MKAEGRMANAEWKTVALGDLVEPAKTWNPSRSTSDEVFDYIDLSAVNQDAKLITGAREVSCGEAPSRARQLVARGDVLVSTVRPNLNGVARVPDQLDGATASTGFCVLRARESKFDGGYLFHWVKSPAFVADMVNKATGASYPAVSDRIIFDSRIPLPPLAEQRRIAEVLDRAEALRAKRRAALAQLDSLTQSLFLDLFGDPATNPQGFPKKPLASLVRDDDTINYGVVQPGDDLEEGIPLVRVGDLIEGKVRHSELKRIAPSIEAAYKRSRLRGDEILVSCVGSIGVVALANESVKSFNIARAVARIPLAETTSRVFMAAYLSTDFVQRYFTNELRTVSQPTLNIKQLSETTVVLPPISLQREFARRVTAVEALKRAQRASLAELDALFATLQHRAFKGEL